MTLGTVWRDTSNGGTPTIAKYSPITNASIAVSLRARARYIMQQAKVSRWPIRRASGDTVADDGHSRKSELK